MMMMKFDIYFKILKILWIKGIEVIRTTISTSKKIELARFEDLEIRQVKINLL
jgi:hypothetical protein